MRKNLSQTHDSGRDHGSVEVAEIVKRVSRKRQDLIRPVLENPSGYVLLSVRALARKLGKDPGTTLRIVQHLGFETYRDFQKYLHNLSIAQATPLQLMQSATAQGVGIRSRIHQSFDQDLKNLQGIKNSVDIVGLERVARRVYKAKRLFIIGGDQAAALVSFLQYNLLMIRLNAFP